MTTDQIAAVVLLTLTAPLWLTLAWLFLSFIVIPVTFGPWSMVIDTFFGTNICGWYIEHFLPDEAFEEGGW